MDKFTVECADHRTQPMDIMCQELCDLGMKERVGFHIVGLSHGVRLAYCSECVLLDSVPDEKKWPVCRQCFNRTKEYQEMKATENT